LTVCEFAEHRKRAQFVELYGLKYFWAFTLVFWLLTSVHIAYLLVTDIGLAPLMSAKLYSHFGFSQSFGF